MAILHVRDIEVANAQPPPKSVHTVRSAPPAGRTCLSDTAALRRAGRRLMLAFHGIGRDVPTCAQWAEPSVVIRPAQRAQPEVGSRSVCTPCELLFVGDPTLQRENVAYVVFRFRSLTCLANGSQALDVAGGGECGIAFRFIQ